jgi:hypothetical protein
MKINPCKNPIFVMFFKNEGGEKMRAFLTWILALGLFLAPTLARAAGNGDEGTGKRNDSASASTAENGNPAKSNSASNHDATPKPDTPAPPAAPKPTLEDQVQELRDLVLTQSKELEATRAEVKEQQEKVRTLEQQLKSSNAASSNAVPAAASNPAPSTPTSTEAHIARPAISLAPSPGNADGAAVATGGTTVATGSATVANGGAAVAPAQDDQATHPDVSPLQLKIGSAYITPVGFMDFTGVWRARNGGSGIGTNFAGIPYGGENVFQANMSEFRFSMQNSRIGFRVDADVKGAAVIGYMEADFLGNNPTNVAVSSNSNTFRSRLYWVDLRKGAWELLGGQTWSLATPNRVGVSPLPADVFFSYNMDTNYQVGMVWARNPELRVVYHLPEDKAAFAIAAASPDQYMGGTNGSAAITLPSCCSYFAGGQLDNGTTTLSPPNKAPDVIAKFVADPDPRIHFEVGGMARFFQVYNEATTTHFSATGGAGFVNLDLGITKELRFLTHNFWSDGGGRYIFGSAPDMIVRGDGSLSLVHSGATMDGVEFSHHDTTLFAYYGAIFIARNVATDTNGCNIGWGYGPSAPGLTGCTAPSTGQNRIIQEPTVGFIKNFWKDPRFGALSLIGQYSYLTRQPWYTAPGEPSRAFSSMAFLDLRYTLPGSAPTLGKPGKE